MQRRSTIKNIENLSQLILELGLPAPLHPLITLVDYNNVSTEMFPKGQKINLYTKSLLSPHSKDKQNTDKDITILKKADWHF